MAQQPGGQQQRSKRPKAKPYVKGPKNRWSAHPALHDQVLSLLQEKDLDFEFQENDNDNGCIKYLDTNIMGKFFCRNKACAALLWSSKAIAITIWIYPGDRYSARVYHQQCKDCNTLGRLVIDETSYVERVATTLKRWSGVPVTPPPHSKRQTRPHESDLCEGCKAGHCPFLRQRDITLGLGGMTLEDF